jgi:BMFP domain-containing protein YqiC
MQTRNPLLDDLARVAAGALGVTAGMRRETEELLKQRFSAVMGRDGFVTREEFEAVKAMAAKARVENEALTARLEALEAAAAKAPAEAPAHGTGSKRK